MIVYGLTSASDFLTGNLEILRSSWLCSVSFYTTLFRYLRLCVCWSLWRELSFGGWATCKQKWQGSYSSASSEYLRRICMQLYRHGWKTSLHHLSQEKTNLSSTIEFNSGWVLKRLNTLIFNGVPDSLFSDLKEWYKHLTPKITGFAPVSLSLFCVSHLGL